MAGCSAISAISGNVGVKVAASITDSDSLRNMGNSGRDNGIVIETLKKRGDFLAARKGVRLGGHFFVLQCIDSPAQNSCPVSGPNTGQNTGLVSAPHRPSSATIAEAEKPAISRFGFTVTKKVGNAVERNRIRRRLKAAVATVAPSSAQAGKDFVLLARRESLGANFASLVSELTRLLERASARNPKNSKNRLSRTPRSIKSAQAE